MDPLDWADSSWIPGKTGNLVDEVPTSRDEYGSKSVLSRPYGLPKSVKMCNYMGESICFLSPHNYKVEARIGVNSSTQHDLLTVLDTGAGPNLIHAAVLPQRLLQSLDSRGVVRLASALKHRCWLLGYTTTFRRCPEFGDGCSPGMHIRR